MEYIDNNGNKFEADELLPCPFCGGTATLVFIGNNYTKSRKTMVSCSTCRVKRTDGAIRFSHEWCAKNSINAWNKRVDTVWPEPKIFVANPIKKSEL